MENTIQILTAIIISHSFHTFGEAANVNAKIKRLVDAKNDKNLKPYPMNINTRAKAYSLGISVFVVVALISYALINVISPSSETLLAISIGLLLFIELYSLVAFDKYHIAIQPIINYFDKDKKGSSK
ncbi:hypothetical protein HZB74_02665 [Candidatus Saccharibacteria bacterium]|nr:hypothetical protein [Candidatus Saccharibacteria bacterium]